jgi:uncharacterized protein
VSADRFHRWTVPGTVLLAAILWFVVFALDWSSFWIKISLSATLLAAISVILQAPRREDFRFTGRTALLGLVSAAMLYFIFWAGKAVSTTVFDFAAPQIGGIYHKGTGTPMLVIALLLFFVTGPSEEIFWRGYLQRHLMARFGRWPGWAITTAIYAGVHTCSLNFMLVGAAAVAGAFWGAMYARLGSLAPVIISHALWSTVIFAVFPLR